MKKLIAIAVVFALAAGGVFAVDISATVFAGVSLMSNGNGKKSADAYDSSKDKGARLVGSGSVQRLRLEGSGENEDGTFGAWLRLEPGAWFGDIAGNAWWKPIDQFKMTIGRNPDSFYGKDGNARWMFTAMPQDIGVAINDNAWGLASNAFWGGFGDNGLMLEIKPIDMIGLTIIFPYYNGGEYHPNQTETAKGLKGIFNHTTLQLDANLDFGNIALTYILGGDNIQLFGEDDYGNPYPGYDVYFVDSTKVSQQLYLYFGLTAIENLSLDLGIGYKLPITYKRSEGSYKYTWSWPLSVGLAAKYDINDSFGLKARFLAEIGGNYATEWAGYDSAFRKLYTKTSFDFAADLLPYYGINDSVKIYLGLGIAMSTPAWTTEDKFYYDLYSAAPILGDASDYKRGKTTVGWHINPYVQVGGDWGPTFYAGVKIWSNTGWKTANPNVDNLAKPANEQKQYTPVCVEIPIGLQVSF